MTNQTQPDREMVIEDLLLARRKLELADENILDAMNYADGIVLDMLKEIREKLLRLLHDINTTIDGLEVDLE